MRTASAGPSAAGASSIAPPGWPGPTVRSAPPAEAMLFEGRTAIVSGIGPGVGRSVALALAREGANVVMGARTEDRLREVAAEVEGVGGKTLWRVTDIRDEEQCLALAEAARETFGGIHALVNNAF